MLNEGGFMLSIGGYFHFLALNLGVLQLSPI